MKKLHLIETIAPMFLAGVDHSKAELRVASIKELLRFWWQALQAEPNLDELHFTDEVWETDVLQTLI